MHPDNICAKVSDGTVRELEERGFSIFEDLEELNKYFQSPFVTNDGQKNEHDSSFIFN